VFTRNSRKQDENRLQKHTTINLKFSAVYMPVVAILLTVISIDWMMSLVHTGIRQSRILFYYDNYTCSLAASTYAAVSLNEKGYLHPSIGPDHYYSSGLYFSRWQISGLILLSVNFCWYGTQIADKHPGLCSVAGNWKYLSIGLIIVRFAIPYAVCLSYPSKVNPAIFKTHIFVYFICAFIRYILVDYAVLQFEHCV